MHSRRAFLAAAATAGVAGCQTGDDGTETGNRTPTGTSTPSEPTDDRVAWTESVSAAVTHRPVVGDSGLSVATEAGTLVSLDADDGSQQWTAETEPQIREPPVAAGGHILVMASADDPWATHTLYALDADTGERQWEFSPESLWLDIVGVDGDTALVVTADDALGPDGETLYALDLADGTPQWSVETGDPSRGVVTDGSVYVAAPGVVQAVDRDGTVAWEFELAPYYGASLSVVGDTVALAVSDDGNDVVVGLDTASGTESWRFEEWPATTVAAVGDSLVAGGDSVGRLDPATGEVVWRAAVDTPVIDPPHTDGTLYVAGDEAAALSLADGDIEWRSSMVVSDGDGPTAPYFARPMGVVDGQVLIQRSRSRDDRNRHLLALETASGDPTWTYTGESELTRLAVGESRAYAGAGESVVALETRQS